MHRSIEVAEVSFDFVELLLLLLLLELLPPPFLAFLFKDQSKMDAGQNISQKGKGDDDFCKRKESIAAIFSLQKTSFVYLI